MRSAFLFVGHRRRGLFDGGDDVRVGGATADVAAHVFADVVVVCGVAFLDAGDRRDDLQVRAGVQHDRVPDDGSGRIGQIERPIAWLHRGDDARPLHCNTGVALDHALVATGFGYAAQRRQVQGEVAAALLPHVRDIRRGGSASVDLCSVAAGRVDAFYERGLNYWDYAAGGLIAREAGALVGGLAGRPEGTSMTVAAGPGLYRQLDTFLTSLNPERDGPRSQEQDALAGPERDVLGVIGVPRVRRART